MHSHPRCADRTTAALSLLDLDHPERIDVSDVVDARAAAIDPMLNDRLDGDVSRDDAVGTIPKWEIGFVQDGAFKQILQFPRPVVTTPVNVSLER
jgi:hypothetical protein